MSSYAPLALTVTIEFPSPSVSRMALLKSGMPHLQDHSSDIIREWKSETVRRTVVE
jgi:hypothetical protein